MSDTRASPRTRRRVIALVLLVVTVALGLFIHTALPDIAATDIAGDALYAVAVYLFVVVLLPRLRPLVVGMISGVWCVGIELFQLTGIPAAAGEVFSPAMLVLGTVFDARDLLIYVVALVVTVAFDLLGTRSLRNDPTLSTGPIRT